jgi:hypothetical protein
MNYSKPEVKTLGQATEVIERTGKTQIPSLVDGPKFKTVNPAYDLDE